MIKLPRAECRSCGAPSSYFALHCPNCRAPNQPNPVATIAALLAVVCIGAAVAVATALFREQPTRQPAPERADTSANPSPEQEADYSWLMEAMAKCEAEAKQQLDTLHFLIVPVTQTGVSLPGWSPSPIGNVGGSAKLLSATDAACPARDNGRAALE